MSTRNPMNERYTTEKEHIGSSRKSAASAKPKAKAANTVTVVSGGKTAKEKKALAKRRQQQERNKQRQEEAKFYAPPTQRYKTLRRLWWVCLIAAILCTALSWILQGQGVTAPTVVTMVLAYVFIIAALIIDLGPTRKERRRYQAAVADKTTEEHKEFVAMEKARKEAEKANKAEAQAAYDASKEKKGFFANLFGGKKKTEATEAEATDAPAEEAK